jgi:choline dehydrogenase-like flavoprotein
MNPAFGTIATGLFSTADLLTEARLSVDPFGAKPPTINLSHAVVKLETGGKKVTKVVAHDLLSNKLRAYQGRYVVLAAGAVESAKIAMLSGLADPNGLVGVGITDHPIFFTHFSVPKGKTWHRSDTSSKTMSRHKQATPTTHPYNMLLELGADLNQGRYLDADTLARHQEMKGDAMLCEVVFLFNSQLVPGNKLDQFGPSFAKPVITMQDSPSADAFWAEINDMKNQIIAELEGEAIFGQDLTLKRAGLGGVAHEVGALRLGVEGTGVVDENLQYNGYDNLFVCDLSVFPTSPAANPTLTLVALSLRLVEYIRSLL